MFSEFKAAGPIGGRSGVEGLEEPPRHLGAEILVAAADEHLFIARGAFEHHGHNSRARHSVCEFLIGGPVRQGFHSERFLSWALG